MCGLVGYLSKNPNFPKNRVVDKVISQFQDQQKRGTEGFGTLEVMDDGYVRIERATTEVKALLDLYRTDSRNILFHHRNPTSTENLMDQAHPMNVEHEELEFVWEVMHNGVIGNSDAMKKKHEELGYVYLTEYKKEYAVGGYGIEKFNDSESLAIEVARFLEGKSKTIDTKGSFAFIATSTDKKGLVKSVYIGRNDSNPINLAEDSEGYMFASEERTGERLEDNTAIRFDAKYGDTAEGKGLIGFVKCEEPIKLEYPAQLILSPISSDYEDHSSYGRHKVGFGANTHRHKHYETPKVGSVSTNATNDDKQEVHFSSFAHIVTYVGRGKLGEVFQDIDQARHLAIEEFDLKSFNEAIVIGNPEKAEGIYNSFIENMTWLDADDVIERMLQPIENKISINSTTEDTIEEFRDASKKRMAHTAKEILPIYLLASYCECVITLAYQYQADQTSRSIDNANPDKPIDEQIQKDVNEAFRNNRDDERETEAIVAGIIAKRPAEAPSTVKIYDSLQQKFVEQEKNESIGTPAENLNYEADVALDTLGQNDTGTPAGEILEEATEVGNTIRVAAEMSILEQLRMVETIASEDGLEMKIPFHINKIKDIAEITRTRFQKLARIVKSAQIGDGIDSFEGSPYLSG